MMSHLLGPGESLIDSHGRVTPSASATAYASAITNRASALPSWSLAISSSVAPVSALIGLNAALPASFTQMSWRMFRRMGHLNPAALSAAERRLHRSLRVPSGSPMASPVAFDVSDNPRFDNQRCRIDNATDHPVRVDGSTDYSAWVGHL